MKLIDINPIIKKYKDYEYFSGYEDFDKGVEARILSVIDELDNASEIDPVHAAGACYYKECLHSELIEYEDNEGWITPVDEYWCNEHKYTMPLNEFCSEGRRDDTKND